MTIDLCSRHLRSPQGHAVNDNISLLTHGHEPELLDGGVKEVGKVDVQGFREIHPLWQILQTCVDMLNCHWYDLSGLCLSFFCCVLMDAVQCSLVDASFFQATGLFLAVIMSMRARTALSRRWMLMTHSQRIMNRAKNIMGLVGGSDRKKSRRLLAYLKFCFEEMAYFMDNLSRSDAELAHSIEDLAVEDREAVFSMRSTQRLRTSPRPLLLNLHQVCEACVDLGAMHSVHGKDPKDHTPATRRFHMNLAHEVQHTLREYDALLNFRQRFLPPQFRWMIQCVIFFYVTLYPWCVWHESALILGLTSIGMGFVFYGLHHVTNGLEDPMQLRGQGLNLHMTFRKMFAEMQQQIHVQEQAAQYLAKKRQDGMELDITEDMHDELVDALCEGRARAREVLQLSPRPRPR